MKKNLLGIFVIVFIATIAMLSCSKSSNTTPASTTATVNINQMQFTPESITVSAGTTITWTNSDNITHTVTSTTGVFNSGNLAAGKNYSFTFSTKGTYPYTCTIHPMMTGTVIVN